jgi:pyrroline-5-carboxylate reductase
MAEQWSTARVGFIGAGQMARALGRRLVSVGLVTSDRLIASDPSETALDRFAQETGGIIVGSNADVVDAANVVVVATKPQSMAEVLVELAPRLGAGKSEPLVVSIAAGVSLDTLRNGLAGFGRLVRVMPNTPCLVGSGASAYALGPAVKPHDERMVREMLQAVGVAHRVSESALDAVTGLSGSGPAFVYMIIEALADGGVRVGLPRDVATSLAAQTVLGAAQMVLETGRHPGELKDQVASPGGTTIAGIHALERGGLRAALMDAVQAATVRSTELAAAARNPKPRD